MAYTGAGLARFLEIALECGCTARQVEVLGLHLGEGLSQAQIADRLGIGQPMVATHLSRARRHLEPREYELAHLLEQEIEEIIGYGHGEDADTRSVWRRAALAHTSSNLHVMKPTRRRRRAPGAGRTGVCGARG